MADSGLLDSMPAAPARQDEPGLVVSMEEQQQLERQLGGGRSHAYDLRPYFPPPQQQHSPQPLQVCREPCRWVHCACSCMHARMVHCISPTFLKLSSFSPLELDS